MYFQTSYPQRFNRCGKGHEIKSTCDCTRRCTDIVRESALKVDWEENLLPPRRIEPTSAACRSNALPKSLRVCGRTNWAVSPWISELDICHKLKVTPRPAEYKGKYSALLFALGSIGFCCCCCFFFFFFLGGGSRWQLKNRSVSVYFCDYILYWLLYLDEYSRLIYTPHVRSVYLSVYFSRVNYLHIHVYNPGCCLKT